MLRSKSRAAMEVLMAMGRVVHGLLLLLLLNGHEGYGYDSASPISADYGLRALNRSSFPPGFIFGAASASYQVEGAWNADGKGLSNLDYFTHKHPEKVADRSNGDVATDSYHLYKEDVKLLKYMNADSYRFSISWSRVIPSGKRYEGINEKGIDYYNKLIDELLAYGVQPIVTLFHWDIPQALEVEYGSFLSEKVIKDFHDFVDLCFERFGDRVKDWITFNEPSGYSIGGYDMGLLAPGRCSAWMNNNCTGGNSGTEPYIVGHNQLLAHADTVQLYKTKYQKLQKGKIGIALVATWMEPLSNSELDRNAAIRALDFSIGWFMNPIVFGDYPPSMRMIVGKRLPRFTKKQSLLLKGSYDFLGLNYYTSFYAGHITTPPNKVNFSSSTDSNVNTTSVNLNGESIGEQAGSIWLHVYPIGIWKVLRYIKSNYRNPIIYITENGVDNLDNSKLSIELALKDEFRIKYYFKHLAFVKKAIDDGVKVRRYYGWSLLDSYEWTSGYTIRFGINYVDFKTLKRYPKLSAQWFKRFLEK